MIFVTADNMSSPDAQTQKKRGNGQGSQQEAKNVLEQQIRFQDYKASFLDLFEFATTFDILLIGVSTIAAIIAGALHPTAPVGR